MTSGDAMGNDQQLTPPLVTRFAPSPTGELHLGNARTALFNLLLARRAGGRFLLRIEDTDAERSADAHRERQLADLRWLGMNWDAGPDREDARGPYSQSQRAPIYARYLAQLERTGSVYPCFCSTLELEVSRRAQLASGKPPRYAGTCRDLSSEEQERRRAQGMKPTLRFRVPAGRRIEFVDLVHGAQSFLSDDIGDFLVQRADGSAAFFFSNAVDDASMGVTHVLRGEDHLANTPRQLLILGALELAAPAYGHVALLLGSDAAPLSKRQGAASVRAYREEGYLPGAILNHLFRLGHSSSEHGFLDLAAMARHFELAHLGRAPAHFDVQQLRTWQKEAVRGLSADEARAWLAPVLPPGLDARAAAAFVEAVRPNVVLPRDAQPWVDVVFGELPPLETSEQTLIREAGREYFQAAARAAAAHGSDLHAIVAAVSAATGRKGGALYMPLRAALTGRAHGPELAPLLRAMPPGKAVERLARLA
ncbi:MAG TPA: glutamate--tRNA ligase [Steroidobacteraceae bacterium]|nr:glutamate--tRNA ligase [Steroidobacteraceae bacterium]